MLPQESFAFWTPWCTLRHYILNTNIENNTHNNIQKAGALVRDFLFSDLVNMQ